MILSHVDYLLILWKEWKEGFHVEAVADNEPVMIK